VGRARGARLHRRALHRRDARPQRPAPRALRRHRRRLRDHGLRGRRARHPGTQDRAQVAAAARHDAAGRHRAGPDHRRRRAEAHAGHGQAVPRVDRPLARGARRAARARAAAALGGAAARPPAGVRLHAGGPQGHPRADGVQRRGADRVDGQRRRAAGALGAAEDHLQLFQAAVRAGDQPADRPDPRGAGDVAGHLHRAAPEPARHRRDEPADAARGAAAGAHRRGDGAHPPRRAVHRRRVQGLRARHLLSGDLGCGRHGGGAGVAVGRGRGRGAPRIQHPDRVRPRGIGRAAPDPGTASRPARHARSTSSRCSRATAPRRSTLTSRWRRSRSSPSRAPTRRRRRPRTGTSRRSARASTR
jgi:hypothetical protein